MSETTEQSWGLFERAGAAATDPPKSPDPDMTWEIPSNRLGYGGTARVYLANSKFGLQRPVILSDGFNAGESNFDALWHDLNGKRFAFAKELRDRGHDLILLGYKERSASILENAEVARHCILRAIAERNGDAPMMVGGFSMGGLVTRYALAKMEMERLDHQTSTYLSFDSPHRGAWIPIGLQALAHFITVVPAMSKQINSPAARQLLWQHIDSVEAQPQQDPLRAEFLEALERVGSWPQRPRKLGVANGIATGVPNAAIPPNALALECTYGVFNTTKLYTQGTSDVNPVAFLKGPDNEKTVRVRGLPEIDGAPGGTLESFAIAADNLNIFLVSKAKAHIPKICFVPSISAVAVRDISGDTLHTKINELSPSESELDEFLCSSEPTLHSEMTPELGNWILARLPQR
jgi:hypothetical protein